MARMISLQDRSARLLAAFALAGAMVLALPATAPAQDIEASKQYLEDANDYLAKGDVGSALIQLKNAVKSDPDNLDARRTLGDLYIRMGDGAAAEKELQAIQRRGVDDPTLLVQLGRAYLLQAKYVQILEEVPSDQADKSVLADALMVRALAYLGIRKPDSAKEALLLAETIKPDDPQVKLAIAQVLAAQNDLPGAEASVDKALAMAPESSEALLMKGELRRLQGDHLVAIGFLDRVIAAQENNARAHLARAAALIDIGENARAEADLGKILGGEPEHPIANYLLALMRAKTGDYTGARDALQAGGAPLVEYMPAVFLSGAVSYARGDLEQAIDSLRRVVTMSPDHVAARKLLAAALVRDKDPLRAIEIAEPMVKPDTTDVQLLSLLGSAYLQAGRYDEASVMFERAAAAAPDAAAIRMQLALTRFAGGDLGEAVGELQSAIELDPDQVQAQIFLALLRMKEGNFDEALTVIDGIGKLLPDNPLTDNLRGAALLGKNDMDGARAAFEAALVKKPGFVPALMNLAQLDRKAGDDEAATRRYREIVAANATDTRARIGLAEIAMTRGDRDGARSALDEAISANPTDPAPRVALVELYLRTGAPDRALSAASEANLNIPDNPTILRSLGLAQKASGDVLGAVDTYRKLTVASPSSIEAVKLLADAQAAAGSYDEARTTLWRALEIDPGDIPTQVAQIELEIRAGRTDDALGLARSFRDRNAAQAIGDKLVGDVYARIGKYTEAAEAYDAGFAKEPSTELAVRRFDAHRRAGTMEKAFADLLAWAAEHPDDKVARYALAAGYLETGHNAEAIAAYEALIGDDPENPVAMNNLAWLYSESGDPRAKETAEKAVALAPEAPAVIDTLAWILVRGGEAQQGLDLLQKATMLAPQEPEIRYHKAVALRDVGRPDEACRELGDLMSMGLDFSGIEDARTLMRDMSCG
jgi:putative PEP-CTERM system TPR-repeat lipoprotein